MAGSALLVNFNSFKQVELSEEDIAFIDQILIQSFEETPLGSRVIIHLLQTEKELTNFELATERLKKITTRLRLLGARGISFETYEGIGYQVGISILKGEQAVRTALFIEKNILSPLELQDFPRLILEHLVSDSFNNDLFINALSNQLVSEVNKQFSTLPKVISIESEKTEEAKYNQLMNVLDKQLSLTNAVTINEWFRRFGLSATYHRHEADLRFAHVPYLTLHRILCDKNDIPLLFAKLKKEAVEIELMREQMTLVEVLWQLKTHQYHLRTGGKVINKKRYETSAGIIIENFALLFKNQQEFNNRESLHSFLSHVRQTLTFQTKEKSNKNASLYINIVKLCNETLYTHPILSRLSNIHLRLASHNYILHGGGTSFLNQRYAKSAAKIVRQLEEFFHSFSTLTPIDKDIERAKILLEDISSELQMKTVATKGRNFLFFYAGGRDEKTANLYQEIVELCRIPGEDNPIERLELESGISLASSL